MSSENISHPAAPNVLSEEELRAELEAAELRKEQDLRKKSRVVSLILCVPTLVLLAAAGIFLLQYQTPSSTMAEKPAPVPLPRLTGSEREAEAAFDPFRPKDQRVNLHEPAAPEAPAPGKIIDKSDLEFATRLLNFGNAADGPPVKAK